MLTKLEKVITIFAPTIASIDVVGVKINKYGPVPETILLLAVTFPNLIIPGWNYEDKILIPVVYYANILVKFRSSANHI